VQYRPFLLGFRSTDPMADYLPQMGESLRKTIVGQQLMTDAELDAAIADCRAHLRNPDVISTIYTVGQVWGRTAT
jgi:hypothetical protein